ncbi:MAG TPA: transcription termination factor NusA [Humisphaera sp.]|jgi:N utilization substance protein A|nr:transcription termination factor NusA [Humisphaera sp.]
MNQELIRIVDGIARDKNIERDQVYSDIEQAIASGLRKQFNTEDTSEFGVTVDRATGDISVSRQGQTLPLSVMGRIGAQTVKQVMIQLIRQDERGSIYEEFKDRVGTIITGTIARFEGGTMIVSLGRAEGIMPRSEQIPGEVHQVGERIQALIMEVRDTLNAVKIILSRSHPELIRRLFEREVPEVGERTIEIKALAREPGHRTKIAVSSIDSKVDAVGACVGVRGSRIKNIVDELGGEKIDIVRWNESSQILIANALKPAEVTEVSLCFELGRATVVVNEDQLSLAIGKRGQNVRLAARLTGWDVDILTPVEFQAGVKRLEQTLKSEPAITQEHVDKIIALGLIDVRDIDEVGVGPLMEEVGIDEATATAVVTRAGEEAKLVAVEQEAKKAADASAKAAGRSALLGGGSRAEAPALAPAPADGEMDLSAILPGPMEAVEGGAPEVTTHQETLSSNGDDLSPEEQAIQGIETAPPNAGEFNDEDAQTAALAEGRQEPPTAGGDEPA